jgi:cytochrome c-type biogenesis protein CcmH
MDETTLFWALALAMAVGTAAALARPLLRAAKAPEVAPDLQIYRDQLAEVERDLARGLIPPDEAARLKTEVSRRLLEADRAAQAAVPAPQARRFLLPAACIGLALAGSFFAYDRLGAPGYPDLPLKLRFAMSEDLRQTRPTQAEAVANLPPATPAPADPAFLDLMDKLRAAMKDRPGDLRGQELLAQNEMLLGNFAAAEAAQRALIAARGDAATGADYAALAEILIRQVNGYVSPEAEEILVQSLQHDPMNEAARFYSGLLFAQIGRPDQTFRLWRPLLEQGSPDAPWAPVIRAEIPGIAAAAGVDYTPPDAAPGPSAEDIAAAQDMSPEDRQQMIRGMVDQLSDRLATQGGTAAEWARLITSLGVLGELDRAEAIWAEAQNRFADRPEDLATVTEAARQTGLIQ